MLVFRSLARAAEGDGRLPAQRRRRRSARSSRCSSGAGSPALLGVEHDRPDVSFLPILRHRHPVRPGHGLRGLPGVAHARGARARRRAAARPIGRRLPARRPGGDRGGADHVQRVRRLRAPAATSIIKSIGFALAVGVLVDAFVVRMTLVPAVMSLLGRGAWWLPQLAGPDPARPRRRGREAHEAPGRARGARTGRREPLSSVVHNPAGLWTTRLRPRVLSGTTGRLDLGRPPGGWGPAQPPNLTARRRSSA